VLGAEIHPAADWTTTSEPSLSGLTGFQTLDIIFTECLNRGIVILLDFHWFITYNGQLGLWYSQGACVTDNWGNCRQFTEADVMNAWNIIVTRYKSYQNFLGIDFFNEAYQSTWGQNIISTDWDLYVTRQIINITSTSPDYNGLFFIEGIADASTPNGCNLQQTSGHWWGGNLELWKCKQISAPDLTRLVYTPHVYGPSLYDQTYFNDPSYPSNMPTIWNAHFGYLKAAQSQAIVVGEWGGIYTGSTKVFQDSFATYLSSNGFGNIYWALIGRPGEESTVDGLITDPSSFSVNTDKLLMLSVTQPNSSRVSFTSCTTGASSVTSSTSSTTSPTSSSSSTSSTTSSTSSTSATTVSTTASTSAVTSSTSSTTLASSTTGSPSNCPIVITQTLVNSWQGGAQFDVLLTNRGTQTYAVSLTFLNGLPQSYWNLVSQTDGSFSLPSYVNSVLTQGATFDWGYTDSSSTPIDIQIVNPDCLSLSTGSTLTSSTSTSPSSSTTSLTSSSSTTSSTSPSSSTTSSTSSSTASSTSSTSTASALTTSTSGTQNLCTLSISQVESNSWNSAGVQFTQWTVTVSNNGQQSVNSIQLSPGSLLQDITQIWSVTPLPSGNFGFPDWISSLTVGSSFQFGYTVQSPTQVQWQPVSVIC